MNLDYNLFTPLDIGHTVRAPFRLTFRTLVPESLSYLDKYHSEPLSYTPPDAKESTYVSLLKGQVDTEQLSQGEVSVQIRDVRSKGIESLIQPDHDGHLFPEAIWTVAIQVVLAYMIRDRSATTNLYSSGRTGSRLTSNL